VQLLKNFPAFYGTRRFITVFTRALHWSLSWARSIQSIHLILSKTYFNTVHPPTSWTSLWSLSFKLSHQYPICIPLRPLSCYMLCSSHHPWLDHSNYYTWRRVQVTKFISPQCINKLYPWTSGLAGTTQALSNLYVWELTTSPAFYILRLLSLYFCISVSFTRFTLLIYDSKKINKQ
jgi:hypothetical protein